MRHDSASTSGGQRCVDTEAVLLDETDLPDVDADDYVLYQRKLGKFQCDDCGTTYDRVVGNVEHEGQTPAVYFADCHRHEDGPQIWMDIILGSWGPLEVEDHVTFACGVGVVEGGKEGATLLDVNGRER